MIIVKKFNDVSELQKLQRIACSVPEDVYLHSMDDSIMVDAKSFINLFTLDFSEPVNPNPGGAGLIPAPLFSFNRQFVTFL